MNWFELGMPRGHCFAWDHVTQFVYVGSALTLTLAYVMIGYGLITSYRRVHNKYPALNLALPFGLFIAACGLGHTIEDVLAFYWPAYRIFAAWKLATAVVSVYAALELPGALISFLLKNDGMADGGG